jgi:hypothetical protein
MACKPTSRIHFTRNNIVTHRDSIHVTVKSDSNNIDTIRYYRDYTHTDNGAVRIHGAWYVIVGVAATIIFFLLWIK